VGESSVWVRPARRATRTASPIGREEVLSTGGSGLLLLPPAQRLATDKKEGLLPILSSSLKSTRRPSQAAEAEFWDRSGRLKTWD